MDIRPVILTQQVCLQYLPHEAFGLMRAANQLPLYKVQEFRHYIRIDCYSLIGRGWRCAFMISRATLQQNAWLLDRIEFLPVLSFQHALFVLAHLENFGLKRLKYGQQN